MNKPFLPRKKNIYFKRFLPPSFRAGVPSELAKLEAASEEEIRGVSHSKNPPYSNRVGSLSVALPIWWTY